MFLSQQSDGVLLALQASNNFYLILQATQMASDQIEIQIPKTIVNESQAFKATAYHRVRSTKLPTTPTTVEYRIDCLTTQTVLRDWTTVTPGITNSITITSADNAIQDNTNHREKKQIVVKSDDGLDTQAIGETIWLVKNIRGV